MDTLHAGGATVSRDSVITTKRGSSPIPTVFPPAKRIIAIGDLHGDLEKARRAFRLAGLIDGNDRWAGGSTVAVQVGDLLDRGDQEIELLYWLERLQREARGSGGDLHVLNGNHETMNVAQSFRYATHGGFESFRRWALTHSLESALKLRCGCHSADELRKAIQGLKSSDGVSARSAALEPGGPLTTRFLAHHPVVLQVGSTVFVHGGLLPRHVDYGVERINEETREWMINGPVKAKPSFLLGRNAVVWSRDYSNEDETKCDCDSLQRALESVPGARRMVVGHTIQEAGINGACNGKVFRVDVGLSKGCGDGHPEVLEIVDDTVIRRLRENETTRSQSSGWEASSPKGIRVPVA
jgi:hypothetical protein